MSRSSDAGWNGDKRLATPAVRAKNVDMNLITAGLPGYEDILPCFDPAECAEKHTRFRAVETQMDTPRP